MAQVDHSTGMLSPAPSETSTFAHTTDLPVPRSHPLIPGSAKETSLINYLDSRITHITGRHAKSFAATKSDHSPDSGYTDFNQVIQDIEPIVDVVWITSTPAIQIPYLLTLAGHFSDYMSAFPFTSMTLHLARKFDQAFSSLLTPSGPGSYHVNPTDKVRIRSLVEESRLIIISTASKGGHRVVDVTDMSDDDDDDEMTTDAESSLTNAADFATTESISKELGKVYEKTIQILGGDISSLPKPRVDSQQTPLALPSTDDVEIIDL